MDDEKRFWVAFNYVKGIGPVRFQSLLDVFGSPEVAWNASIDELQKTGLSNKVVENLLQVRSQISIDKIWNDILKKGIKVLTWMDSEYPRRLKDINQPPPVIYVKGQLIEEDDWAVAIVGTRRMTGYGRMVAEDTAQILALNGITVVSGLARGIDSIAHKAAIESGGRTLAVLGNGVDRIYPPENRSLGAQIIENGALLSNYPPGTPPESSNFPPRNRIISGLCRAVVIVEAGKRSGALITAQYAAEQGRDVFAVPGNINAAQSIGSNRLIRDGAFPLLSPVDILDVLNLSQVSEFHEARRTMPVDPQEDLLLNVIGTQPMHIDEITHLADLPADQVAASLTMMELKGLVRQVGRMNYIAIREQQEEYGS